VASQRHPVDGTPNLDLPEWHVELRDTVRNAHRARHSDGSYVRPPAIKRPGRIVATEQWLFGSHPFEPAGGNVEDDGTLLDAVHAEARSFRCDLAKGRFWWTKEDGTPVVVAATRLISTYALSNRSVLMGWANASVPEHAAVRRLAGVPDRIPDCSEADAFMWATLVADTSGADFMYRAPNPQIWTFLALWDVREAGDGDEPFVPVAPWAHVVGVLDGLVQALDGGRDVRDLARGYGGTFAQNQLHRDTAHGQPLRSIGERLAALAKRGSPDIGQDLNALRDEALRLLGKTSGPNP
jgi:hypothetical protein